MSQHCEICEKREAAVFMVIRQDVPSRGQRVAKAHTCLRCFELVQEKWGAAVEAVSLQEFKEERETWQEMRA